MTTTSDDQPSLVSVSERWIERTRIDWLAEILGAGWRDYFENSEHTAQGSRSSALRHPGRLQHPRTGVRSGSVKFIARSRATVAA